MTETIVAETIAAYEFYSSFIVEFNDEENEAELFDALIRKYRGENDDVSVELNGQTLLTSDEFNVLSKFLTIIVLSDISLDEDEDVSED